MIQESTMVKRITAFAEGTTDVSVYTQQMQNWNQANIQSVMQAIAQNAQENLGEMLKHYRKIRKAIAGMEKTSDGAFLYECGIFNGTYKIAEEIHRIYLDQQDSRNALNLLGRKHVGDILVYLYKNPNARHNSIAEHVDVKPNHLSEILRFLREAGFVEREGTHKNTKYYLTRTGRQTYKIYFMQRARTEDYIDIIGDFREIPDEKEYVRIVDRRFYEKEKFRESGKSNLKGEDRYGDAKWKENNRIDSEIANQWDAMGRPGVG